MKRSIETRSFPNLLVATLATLPSMSLIPSAPFFRQKLTSFENHCRITGVTYQPHLFASHIKPWRESTNEERLDGENGLLLTPSIDHLFDRGFISFEDNGELMISDVAHKESVQRMGVDTEHVVRVGKFSEGQQFFLAHHRSAVFLQARSAIR